MHSEGPLTGRYVSNNKSVYAVRIRQEGQSEHTPAYAFVGTHIDHLVDTVTPHIFQEETSLGDEHYGDVVIPLSFIAESSGDGSEYVDGKFVLGVQPNALVIRGLRCTKDEKIRLEKKGYFHEHFEEDFVLVPRDAMPYLRFDPKLASQGKSIDQ